MRQLRSLLKPSISMSHGCCHLGFLGTNFETDCRVWIFIENILGINTRGRKGKKQEWMGGDSKLSQAQQSQPTLAGNSGLNWTVRVVLHQARCSGHITSEVGCPWEGVTLEEASLHNWGHPWRSPGALPPAGARCPSWDGTWVAHLHVPRVTYRNIFTQLSNSC